MKIVFRNINWWMVFIIFVLPILLNIWFFVFPWSTEVQSFGFDKSGKIEYPITEYNYEKITKNFLSEVLRVPFEFKTIMFCFEDNGSYYEYETPNGLERFYDDFYWLVEFSEGKNMIVLPNKRNCEKIDLTMGPPPIGITSKIVKTIERENDDPFYINFTGSAKVFGRKNVIEIIQKSVIFFLAWIAVIWLLTRAWTLIKKEEK